MIGTWSLLPGGEIGPLGWQVGVGQEQFFQEEREKSQTEATLGKIFVLVKYFMRRSLVRALYACLS